MCSARSRRSLLQFRRSARGSTGSDGRGKPSVFVRLESWVQARNVPSPFRRAPSQTFRAHIILVLLSQEPQHRSRELRLARLVGEVLQIRGWMARDDCAHRLVGDDVAAHTEDLATMLVEQVDCGSSTIFAGISGVGRAADDHPGHNPLNLFEPILCLVMLEVGMVE